VGSGYQPSNWVWEGSISGLSITPSGDRDQWAAYNTLHCGNDALFASAPNVPEPASCVLLACAAGGIGAMLKRRRKR